MGGSKVGKIVLKAITFIARTVMWAPEYLARACASTGPTLVQCRDRMWAHMCLSSLNKCRTSLGQRTYLDVGSVGIFRGTNESRIHLGCVQGHRGALRSVVDVFHRGSTQPDSAKDPRVGPRSIFWCLDNRCALRSVEQASCGLRLEQAQDSAQFTGAT